MKKLYAQLLSAGIVALSAGFCNTAEAEGWPANYEGVMLQGFYWDSYKGSNTTKWTDLTNKSDELSKYFKLIWVPNCSQANGENNGAMGYMPIYWFSHHNCAFGSEADLKQMISTYKSKGVGFIEDVVINHRVGVANWADFPAEVWNGTTYQLKNTDVCSTDEWRNNGGNPQGNPDTGDDFNGARDLDHKSSNVQNNCKAYCKYLLDELGFVGFRLDMVKGYSGEFTKMYNQYSKPTYCVGEYWDGRYDAVKGWIDATGKESAAFDFPFKYQVNKCFNGGANDYGQLVWKANGTTDQPAGMIHFGYSQYAVTFIDNHDTYRDGSKMTGDVLQANAFMLASPGTPCVFYPHYTQYKAQIQAMIDARNGAGIHNNSKVNVLEVSRSCYVAEITGTKGKLWIKLGNSSKTPGAGYTKKASGNGYELWSTAEGGNDPVIPNQGEVKIYFQNDKNWETPHIHYWGGAEPKWPGEKMSKDGDVWSYTCPEGTTGLLFNAGDGDATKTADFAAIHNHIYSTTGDQGEYNGGSGNDVTGEYYIIGNLSPASVESWVPGEQVAMTKKGNSYEVSHEIVDAGNGNGYYSIVTNNATSWDGDDANPGINSADRYGAASQDTPTTLDTEMPVTKYAAGVNASSAKSWVVPAGNYTFVFNPTALTLKVSKDTNTGEISIDINDSEAMWFTLQGIRVNDPQPGQIYIRVRANKADKVRL